MRPCVALSTDDHIAALQIVAHLAYPRRVNFALSVLEQWNRHLAREAPAEKWSRVEPKLWRLHDMFRRRLTGAYWLRLQVNQKVGELTGDFFHAASQRACARRFGRDGESETNVITKYWTMTRSVAHLGLATGDAIMMAYSPAERLANEPWRLQRIAFRPDWVGNALKDAERNAAAAADFGVIPLDDAILFKRDNI